MATSLFEESEPKKLWEINVGNTHTTSCRGNKKLFLKSFYQKIFYQKKKNFTRTVNDRTKL